MKRTVARYFLFPLSLSVALSVWLSFAKAEASFDKFFDYHASGKLVEAYKVFPQALDSAETDVNFEILADTLISMYPKVSEVPMDTLTGHLGLLLEKNSNAFLQERIPSDISALSRYDELVDSTVYSLEKELERIQAISNDPVRYNHERMSALRILKMALESRKFKRGDIDREEYYLWAATEYGLSGGGFEFLKKYFLVRGSLITRAQGANDLLKAYFKDDSKRDMTFWRCSLEHPQDSRANTGGLVPIDLTETRSHEIGHSFRIGKSRISLDREGNTQVKIEQHFFGGPEFTQVYEFQVVDFDPLRSPAFERTFEPIDETGNHPNLTYSLQCHALYEP